MGLNSTKTTEDHGAARTAGAKKSRQVVVDHYAFQEVLDGSDLTEVQRQRFMSDLWSMMVALIDLGYEVHPVQQAASNLDDLDKDIVRAVREFLELAA